MVRLDRIYTRSGDEGQTSLASGERCSKLDQRIIAGGAVDELNSLIGLAINQTENSQNIRYLQTIQQHLFDLGADLSSGWPEGNDDCQQTCPRIADAHTKWLEALIDRMSEVLEPLTSFVLPGGSIQSSVLHVARSVCRRVEIEVLRMQQAHAVNPQIPVYLNRLSDALFVFARLENNKGRTDVLWTPGSAPVDDD